MEAGICPNCQSDNIDYDNNLFHDNQMSWDAKCNDCKTTFKEWYSINFTNISDIRKENNEDIK